MTVQVTMRELPRGMRHAGSSTFVIDTPYHLRPIGEAHANEIIVNGVAVGILRNNFCPEGFEVGSTVEIYSPHDMLIVNPPVWMQELARQACDGSLCI